MYNYRLVNSITGGSAGDIIIALSSRGTFHCLLALALALTVTVSSQITGEHTPPHHTTPRALKCHSGVVLTRTPAGCQLLINIMWRPFFT